MAYKIMSWLDLVFWQIPMILEFLCLLFSYLLP